MADKAFGVGNSNQYASTSKPRQSYNPYGNSEQQQQTADPKHRGAADHLLTKEEQGRNTGTQQKQSRRNNPYG